MAIAESTRAVAALVAGAVIWGVIWYPYRLLQQAGIGAIAATTLTYLVALLIGAVVLRRHLRQLRPTPLLIAIAAAAAACNLGYVLATVHGEVMRVLLLFYLAPLWTVLLSRVMLGERLGGVGAAIIAVSLAGAATMLWHPQLGMPWPRDFAEWVGLAAGLLFALTNVLIRRAGDIAVEVKALAVFIGATLLGAVLLGAGVEAAPAGIALVGAALAVAIGIVLLAINLIVQYGLMRIPANRAIVILLSELVFAAVSSAWLAGERMGWQEWVGGGLIVAASLFSARIASPPQASASA